MKNKENHTKGLVFISMKKGKPSALLPIAVFLVFYLGLGIYSEYILKIPMGFYNIPIVVAFLAAILVACLQNRSVPFEEKLALMGQGIGDKNIITMLLIFLAAGTFVGVVGRSSAESVAYFLSLIHISNRHFRLCRASSSRKNRSILPMSSTCFSRFWNR